MGRWPQPVGVPCAVSRGRWSGGPHAGSAVNITLRWRVALVVAAVTTLALAALLVLLMPAGAGVGTPADLLDSERLDQILQSFRQVFDVVVLDCPPVMAVSDASIVANAAASVVVVVAAGSTSPEVAKAALERLTSVKARVVGAVLNKTSLSPRSDYYYSDYASEVSA